jgi:ATPase family protein associated with various cellular activities (AAA)/winged helix domain-containing protein
MRGDGVMEEGVDHDWVTSNQAGLAAALADIKATLARHADRGTSTFAEDEIPKTLAEEASSPAPLRGGAAALDALCTAFNLSVFERSILLLCAGIELDSTVASLCAAAQGNPQRNYPTFSLALAAFPEAHWSALTPEGPLRRWRLINLGTGSVLTSVPLRVDERVLHLLTGISQVDDRLAVMLDVIPPIPMIDLAPSHAALAETIMSAWRVTDIDGTEVATQPPAAARPPVAVQLCGTDLMESRNIVAAAATATHLRCFVLATDLLPTAPAELDITIRLLERETVLSPAVFIIEFDVDAPPPDDNRARVTARLIQRLNALIVTCSRDGRKIAHRASITLDVAHPTNDEQRSVWRSALFDLEDPRPIERIASQFSMSLPEIRSVTLEVLARKRATDQDLATAAWNACRARSRSKLDGLAQRIEPAANWEDLVLPAPQVGLLRQVAMHVRQRATVFDTWGFAAKSSRGKGITALFSGASGTGKTMAAEVLADELRLDLYRVDLSAVVNKYIGETEKNLRRVFDAAEKDGAVLLFDEADALFGKRSEVKDSHDRYSNIEVSYLLQRMEEYRGLAILTTNMKNALDTAFLRRIRFIVQFPFPDIAQRAEIWRRVFPEGTPTETLEIGKLARLNVAGGNIRNIAVNAAFLAADAGERVCMRHLLEAVHTEYSKMQKTPTDAEIGNWI